MKRIPKTVFEQKITNAAAAALKAAEETVTISRKNLTLEILVALLGGIVIGMFLSPRKKITYKIACDNGARVKPCDNCPDIYVGEETEEPEYADEDDDIEDAADDEIADDIPQKEELENNGKFIKL